MINIKILTIAKSYGKIDEIQGGKNAKGYVRFGSDDINKVIKIPLLVNASDDQSIVIQAIYKKKNARFYIVSLIQVNGYRLNLDSFTGSRSDYGMGYSDAGSFRITDTKDGYSPIDILLLENSIGIGVYEEFRNRGKLYCWNSIDYEVVKEIRGKVYTKIGENPIIIDDKFTNQKEIKEQVNILLNR